MHGAHIAITRFTLPVAVMPVAKAAEQIPSVKASFASSWAKAIQAAAGGGTISVPASKISPLQTKSDVSAAKTVQVEPDKEETPDEARELVQAAQDEVSEPVKAVAPVVTEASKVAITAPELKKTAIGGMSVAETKKQKSVEKDSGASPAETQVAADAALVAPAGAPVVVTPVAVPVVVAAESDAQAASMATDVKGATKTETTGTRRERAAVANGDDKGGAPAAAAATKASGEAEDAKSLPKAEVTAQTFEGNATTPALSHTAATADAHAAETNVSVPQGLVATAAPGSLHKAEGTTATSDLQSITAGAGGADTNAVQALSAGPGQLEVGVLDGTHGWLKIRAELGADGQVNALLTSNASAHEALRDSVPALAGYLDSESVNVSRIAVHQAPSSAGAGGDMTNGGASAERDGASDPNSGYSGSGDKGSGSHGGDANVRARATAPQAGGDASLAGISAAVFGAGAGYSGNGIGSWLSVTA